MNCNHLSNKVNITYRAKLPTIRPRSIGNRLNRFEVLEKMAKGFFLFPIFLHNGVVGHRGYGLKWYKPCKFCGNPALWNVPFPIFGGCIFVDLFLPAGLSPTLFSRMEPRADCLRSNIPHLPPNIYDGCRLTRRGNKCAAPSSAFSQPEVDASSLSQLLS